MRRPLSVVVTLSDEPMNDAEFDKAIDRYVRLVVELETSEHVPSDRSNTVGGPEDEASSVGRYGRLTD